MEWFLLLVTLTAGGGATAFASRKVVTVRADRRRRAEELEGLRRLADEDVTVFGEQLQRLGAEVADINVHDHVPARREYQTALDAYERAKRDAPRLQDIEEISALVDTLATGRYAVACVRARVAGEPVPERRVPCFFNPQHGPSAQVVEWTSTRHGTRLVPACRQCAARVAAREKPEVRTVRIGSRTVPYWDAGTAYHPYTRGNFPGEGAASLEWVWMVQDLGRVHQLGGAGMDGGFGGFDGGGFDGGGGGGD